MKSVVVVPTYNEALNVEFLSKEILSTVPELHILFVDDNSPDNTSNIVRRLASDDWRIHLLLREKKEGLGPAYIAGFGWAIANGYECAIEMDADFSHNPKYLKPMVELLNDFDVVIGTRYIAGGGVSGWSGIRKFISLGGNIYAKTLLNLPYRDLTGGFTGWRTKALSIIDYSSIQSKGYAFQVELKYRSHKKNLRITEFPILFTDRKQGKSKMSFGIVIEAMWRVLQLKFI